MPSKSKAQQRLFGMVHACQKTGKCASPRVEKIAGEIGQKDAEDFAKTKRKGLPNKVNKKRRGKMKSFKEWVQARESFNPKNKLKGKQKSIDVAPPFGKIDGKDFERLRKGKELKEWDPNEPDEGPESEFEYDQAVGEKEIQARLAHRDGRFHDLDRGKDWPQMSHPSLQAILGRPDDSYTMRARVSVAVEYTKGLDYGGGDARGDEEARQPELYVEEFSIANDKTGKEADLPVELARGVIGFSPASVYLVDYDFHHGKVSINVK